MTKKPKRGAKAKPNRSKKPSFNPAHLPPTLVVYAHELNDDGELIAVPEKWDAKKKPPYIVVTDAGKKAAAKVGDKLLVKLTKVNPYSYHAKVITILPSDAPKTVLGVMTLTADGGVIDSISRKDNVCQR